MGVFANNFDTWCDWPRFLAQPATFAVLTTLLQRGRAARELVQEGLNAGVVLRLELRQNVGDFGFLRTKSFSVFGLEPANGFVVFGLSLRDTCICILFFNLLCSAPPAYLCVLALVPLPCLRPQEPTLIAA